jgi:drug/metabolite transporter (DMT)-like permease
MQDRKLLLHVCLLLLFSALIGAIYPLVKIAEQTIPPLTLTLLRAVLAALILLLAVGGLMKRNLAPLLTQWKTFAILGLLLSGFFIALTEAEESVSSSLSAVLACLLPISTFLITTLVLRWERFSFSRLAGAFLALGGVAVFIGLHAHVANTVELVGVATMAGGYVIYAIYLVFARTRNLDPYLAATGTMIFVSGFMAVAAFVLERPLEIQASSQSLLATLFIGIFSTGLGYVVLYYLIANAGPVFTSTFGYFMPIFAVLASHFLIGEQLGWLQVAGVALTLAGAWLVNRQPEAQDV